jgi:hypothetical protein
MLGRVAALSLVCLAACAGCDKSHEPPAAGPMSEPVTCLNEKKVCVGMPATAIDEWIAHGGAVRIRSASCEPDHQHWQSLASTADVLVWCKTDTHVFVSGRRVDYAFSLADGRISAITIERRGGHR